MAIERKFNQTQQEVINLLADRFHTEPTEWHTRGNFTDCHGCDGYIFKTEKAATRYIYGDGLQMFMDYCDGAATEVHEKTGFEGDQRKELEKGCSHDDPDSGPPLLPL